ncbi:MAG: GTPase [Phycisphaeraceae bacterium]
MPHSTTDTIVAVSSPPGRSPRGLIRLSGPGTEEILALIVVPRELKARQLLPCRIQLDEAAPPLPALLAFFPAPRSYTGQPIAELQPPGNPALLERVLHRIIALGARLAEPGEFTFRAYLAGKMDLTQAEGIAATIAAVSDGQLQAATMLRQGKLGRISERLVYELGNALALVEAGIDFVDQDDVVPIAPAALDRRLSVIHLELDELLLKARAWGAIEALPRVVLVGPPSAGKSTLLNALLGRQRAVISETPGTTRDVLAEPLTIQTASGAAIELMLVDIAGLDEARSAIDRDMQAAARGAIESADLLLLITDASAAACGVAAPVPLPPHKPSLHVRTKADLPSPAPPVTPGLPGLPAITCDVTVSAHTSAGLDALRSLIAERLASRAVSLSADTLALQPRHESALRAARIALVKARQLVDPQVADLSLSHVELIASALRETLDHLAGLGGELTPDDVIGRIFSTFCIGK